MFLYDVIIIFATSEGPSIPMRHTNYHQDLWEKQQSKIKFL